MLGKAWRQGWCYRNTLSNPLPLGFSIHKKLVSYDAFLKYYSNNWKNDENIPLNFEKAVEIWWHCFPKNGNFFSQKDKESSTKYTYFTIFLFFVVAKFQNSPHPPTHPPKRKKGKKKGYYIFAHKNCHFLIIKRIGDFYFSFFLVQIQLKLLKYFWKNS